MTIFMCDIASYQGSLKLADVKRAGFDAVNFKTSHGLGVKSVHPNLAALVVEARRIGLHLSTFHYLTGEASGTAQARHAYDRLAGPLNLAHGTVHQVDCEDTATLPILTDYLREWERLAGRRPVVYSADWWWHSRGWDVRPLSPHVWAAPNDGYQSAYPGDTSPLWRCGWGGWADMSILQYEVGVLRFPDGTRGTIKVSKSAIRDVAVWADLAGGQMTQPVCTVDDLEQFTGEVLQDPWTAPRGWELPPGVGATITDTLPKSMPRSATARAAWIVVPALNALLDEINEVAPDRDKASDGSIGDQAHSESESDHNPDETGNADTDSDSINEVRARDFDKDLRRPGLTMEMICQFLVMGCRSGRITWIKYLIFNGRIWSAARDWVTRTYTGSNPHDKHMHVSCKPDTASENSTAKVGLAALIGEDEAMAFIENQTQFNEAMSAFFRQVMHPNAPESSARNALRVAPWNQLVGRSGKSTHDTLFVEHRDLLIAILNKVTEDDAEVQQILAAIEATPAATLDLFGDAATSPAEKAELLRAALGDDAAEVGRLLAGS